MSIVTTERPRKTFSKALAGGELCDSLTQEASAGSIVMMSPLSIHVDSTSAGRPTSARAVGVSGPYVLVLRLRLHVSISSPTSWSVSTAHRHRQSACSRGTAGALAGSRTGSAGRITRIVAIESTRLASERFSAAAYGPSRRGTKSAARPRRSRSRGALSLPSQEGESPLVRRAGEATRKAVIRCGAVMLATKFALTDCRLRSSIA